MLDILALIDSIGTGRIRYRTNKLIFCVKYVGDYRCRSFILLYYKYLSTRLCIGINDGGAQIIAKFGLPVLKNRIRIGGFYIVECICQRIHVVKRYGALGLLYQLGNPSVVEFRPSHDLIGAHAGISQ